MDSEDELMERLAFRAERMKLKAERARRAQHEASARLDSVEYELATLRRELEAAPRLPPLGKRGQDR
jgi:hypothetical protein